MSDTQPVGMAVDDGTYIRVTFSQFGVALDHLSVAHLLPSKSADQSRNCGYRGLIYRCIYEDSTHLKLLEK